VYVKGCETTGDSKDGFEEAIEAARSADIIILAIGESAWMSGEAASRAKLDLPGVQLDLAKELMKTGKPIVVVLMNGRPLAIPWISENATSILETWFSGTQGGNAIADILFGDYNPSGKLTVTFPRHVGQVPIYYCMKNTGRPMNAENKYTSKYLDMPNSPLYPFGFGLSYTTFEYSQVSVNTPEFSMADMLSIEVTVTNTGAYDGEEVVQLYVKDLVGSVTRPVRELKGFKKIQLKTGESQAVKFNLSTDDLAFYTADMIFKAEPGEFEISVGGDSQTTNSIKVVLK